MLLVKGFLSFRVLIISLSLYSLNPLCSGIKGHENSSKGFMGLILTLILFVIVVCFLLRVF